MSVVAVAKIACSRLLVVGVERQKGRGREKMGEEKFRASVPHLALVLSHFSLALPFFRLTPTTESLEQAIARTETCLKQYTIKI